MANDADDAAFLASSYGLTPDRWQVDVLSDWMGRRRDGKWSASKCGLAVPRQNGKNGAIEVRELFGMIELGERFLHTAHEVKTARKAFLRISGFFENPRKYPELVALVKDIRKTNGQEAIVLENGGSVEFVARSKGSGRGFTVDVLVLDEAQDLKDEELEALKPTISAAPQGNPQTIYTGTPPDAEKGQTGEVFGRLRKSAELDPRRLAWTDFGVADGPLDEINLDDRDLWYRTNPALGGRLQLDVLLDERDEMSPDGFARERLGWWGVGVEGADAPIPLPVWQGLTDAGHAQRAMRAPAAFAVEVSLDRVASIAAASQPLDGRIAVELVERRRGIGWVVEACMKLRSHGVPFVVDKAGPGAALIGALTEAGVDVEPVSTGAVASAFALLVDAALDGHLSHGPQPELDAAVAGAKRREMGDGLVTFGRRKSTADVTPLVAVMLAHWAAKRRSNSPEVWSIADMVTRIKAERAANQAN